VYYDTILGQIPKETDELKHGHGRRAGFQTPKDLWHTASCKWQRMFLYMVLLTLCLSGSNFK
jgi:hypothetical protein